LAPGQKKKSGAISNSKGFHAPSRANERAKTMKNLSGKEKAKQFRSSKRSQRGVKSMLNLPKTDNIGGFNDDESLALEDTGNNFLRQSQHSYGGDSFRSSP
jgi:hypothetical protein